MQFKKASLKWNQEKYTGNAISLWCLISDKDNHFGNEIQKSIFKMQSRKTYWKCHLEKHIGNSIAKNKLEMPLRKTYAKYNQENHFGNAI